MRLLKTIALAAMIAGLAALPANAQSALTEILNTGVLKVGTTGDFAPMSVRDPATNNYQGYDIDVMTQLAKDMDVTLEFVPANWSTLVNGVVAGNYHVTGSASIQPGRMKAAGYTETYLSAEMYPFTTSDKIDRFNGWDSINKSDVSVAATLGTTFETWVRDWFPEANITAVEAPVTQHQEVLAGRADVFVTSNIEGATLLEKFDNVRRIPTEAARAPSLLAMLVKQDDQVWINYLNNWIKIKKASGFFDVTAKKWGL